MFRLIQDFPDALILEIQNHEPTHDDFISARQIIKSGYAGCDLFDAAWSLLVVNRLAFQGFIKPILWGFEAIEPSFYPDGIPVIYAGVFG